MIWQLVLGLAKFYLGLARNSKLENILMLSVSKLPFQRILGANGFLGQRLRRFNGKIVWQLVLGLATFT
jgi:hypothetical protein